MARRTFRSARLVFVLAAGLALALAPATASMAQGTPEGPPACTEPADPNQGPPSNPPENTPLSADPADPGECPEGGVPVGSAGAAADGTTGDSEPTDGDDAEVAGAVEAADGDDAEVAGAVEAADGETLDELARTGTPVGLVALIGAGFLLSGGVSLALGRRQVWRQV